MAENKNENQQSQTMLDKTYVVEGFDPSKLQNADVNLSQYGDDSSEANYNNPSLWGGENTKYTGENTLGSQVAYNPNATVEGLDPNYLYGQEAQMQNSKEANYIAKRNDEIASALYNAGKTSIQDVNDFLDSQRGFYNSVGNERANTVAAVWKRIGQIAEQNKQEEENKPEVNEDALANMEGDLNKSTAGEIYGKATADQDTHITTLEDENSVFSSMNQSRINAFKLLETMTDESIAAAIIGNTMSSDGQAMRDLMQYDPAKYEAVKLAEKKIRGQMAIDAITKGEDVNSSVVDTTNTETELTSYAVSGATETTSATQLLQSIESILSSNKNAQSAQELMQSIEGDMAKLKSRLRNLKTEANNVFKGDVPQYIVNAYVANRTAEIQNQMQILEDRYNAAYSRYQNEVQQAQWEKEYELKKEELQLKRDAFEAENYMSQNGLTSSTSTYTGTRAERHNNPTAMITAYAKQLGGVLGVDYEIGDSFVGEDGKTYYTARLIGDPIEKTIELIDRGIENNVKKNVFTAWSYSNKLGMNNEKWKNMSYEEKEAFVRKWVNYEGGSIENMAYYKQNEKNYDLTYQSAYEKYLSGDYSKAWLETQAKTMGLTEMGFAQQAKAYQSDKDAGLLDVMDDILTNGGKRVRNDGKVFDFSTSGIYKQLSERDKEAVQALLNNSISKKYINSNRTSYDDPSGIFSAVSQIDPTRSETWFSNREKAENKRELGKEGGWISRNETAMSTIKDVYGLVETIPDVTWDKLEKWANKNNIKTLKDLANWTGKEFGDENVVYMQTLLKGLQSEMAGALKGGNAANAIEDERKREEILNMGLSQNQMKSALTASARLLYLKDESEVKDIVEWTFIKPKSTWTTDVTDRMYDTIGLKSLTEYYDYTPKSQRNKKMTAGQRADLFNIK